MRRISKKRWMRLGILALMAGFCSMGALADATVSIDSSAMNNGYMNVSDLNGTYVEGYPWEVADLSTSFDGSGYEVTMVPNSINDTNEYWYIGGGAPGNPGNKIMEASLYNETTDVYGGQILTFKGHVSSITLSNTHTVVAYIRDFVADYSSHTEITAPLTATGGFEISLAISGATGNHVQYGLRMDGPCVWHTDLAPFGSVVVTVADDSEAPTPDPMGFAVAPYAVSGTAINMTALNAVDNLTGVEYSFSNTVTGVTSGWQSDTNYTATGLSPVTEYFFTVKARDTHPNHNETAASPPEPATTLSADSNPPTPNPMYFDSTDPSSQSIKLTATTATDDQTDVEYFFDCVAGDGVDSEWQLSPVYINTGLAAGSNYIWNVKARDLNGNTTSASSNVVVTTWPNPGSFSMSNSLRGYTGNNNQDGTVHDTLKDNIIFSDYENLNKRITFDGSGATFGGIIGGDDGRNVLRTMGAEYADSSFEAYVSASGWTGDENIFIGLGPGDIGAYGVPDWSPNGETTNASLICEIHGSNAGIWSQAANSTGKWDMDAQSAIGLTLDSVQRIKLAYDSSTHECTLTVDLDYDGTTFDSDVVVGPVTVPVLSQSRVFLAGDDGIILSNFEIVGESAPVIDVDDIAISAIGSGMLLTWTSVYGQTYDVVYKTDLVSAPSWTTDTSPGCSNIPGTGGSISATSTVNFTEAFYSVVVE